MTMQQVLQQWWSVLLPRDMPVFEPVPPVHSFRTAGTRFPILSGRPEAGHWNSLFTQMVSEFPVQIGLASEAGDHDKNEDTAITFLSQIDLDGELVPVSFAVIADGLGGRWGGEYASAVAAETIADQVIDRIIPEDPPEFVTNPHSSSEGICLADAMLAAHELVSLYLPGSGTTATCLLTVGDKAQIAHVGDSRAYLMVDGKLQQLTRDHSLPRLLQEQGKLTSDQVRSYAQRSFLYQYVGMNSEFQSEDIDQILTPASLVLLCSDGLWESLEDDQIEEIITTWGDPQTACDKLVQQAQKASTPNNATAVIVQLSE